MKNTSFPSHVLMINSRENFPDLKIRSHYINNWRSQHCYKIIILMNYALKIADVLKIK